MIFFFNIYGHVYVLMPVSTYTGIELKVGPFLVISINRQKELRVILVPPPASGSSLLGKHALSALQQFTDFHYLHTSMTGWFLGKKSWKKTNGKQCE